jgi:hypothetical protein
MQKSVIRKAQFLAALAYNWLYWGISKMFFLQASKVAQVEVHFESVSEIIMN